MPTLTETIAGDTPSSLTLLTLERGDNGLTPPGVTPPAAFTGGPSVWTFAFTDAAGAPFYAYTLRIAWSDGTHDDVGSATATQPQATGVYTSQSLVERVGRLDSDIWSNINNDTAAPDMIRWQSAITRIDNFVNWLAVKNGYATPIPGAANLFPRVQDLAVNLVLADLYLFPRGLRDKTDAIGGKLAKLRDESTAGLEELFSSGDLDAPRPSSSYNQAGITVITPKCPPAYPCVVPRTAAWGW